MPGVDELYVAARRVLLDALEALREHRDAMVLVGAQAIYLRVGESDLAVAPYTTDGDLAIDPNGLSADPPLQEVLSGAEFQPKSGDSVGIWITSRATKDSPTTEIAVDLLVPKSLSPAKGRRSARLSGHDARAARIVSGLEGAIVDADVMRIDSLESGDTRTMDLRVAGPAALLVAKLHKIADRTETHRLSDKDALDIFRLFRGTTTDDLASRYQRILADPRSKDVSEAGLGLLRELFVDRPATGIEMLLRAVGSLEDPEQIAASCKLLAEDLLHALGK